MLANTGTILDNDAIKRVHPEILADRGAITERQVLWKLDRRHAVLRCRPTDFDSPKTQ